MAHSFSREGRAPGLENAGPLPLSRGKAMVFGCLIKDLEKRELFAMCVRPLSYSAKRGSFLTKRGVKRGHFLEGRDSVAQQRLREPYDVVVRE